jgi:hypothetical protein
MSAGTGVEHSEYNTADDETRLLQIWILPKTKGGTPGYEQKHFEDADLKNRLRLVVSPDGRDGSVRIQQDASVYAARLDDAVSVTRSLIPRRRAYLQLARGALLLNGKPLREGDGAMLENEASLTLQGMHNAEALLFDLP